MKKYYSEPELEIRKYGISANGIFTTSDLDDDDVFNNTTQGSGGANMFNEKKAN